MAVKKKKARRKPVSVDRSIDRNIEKLEEMAAAVLATKKDTLSRRPIVIEFCGTPKAGKSSCIASLVIFLKRNNFRVRVLTERASVCPIKNKFDPSFNVWTGSSALGELAEVLSNKPRAYDVVILDRGLFDAACWFHWQRINRYLDAESYKRFIDFFLVPRWLKKIDLVYVFKANPETALEREYATLLTRKYGSVMNPEVLAGYNHAIEGAINEHGDKFRKVQRLDTSRMKQNDVSLRVTTDILGALDELISEKVGFIRRSSIEGLRGDVLSFDKIDENVERLEFGARVAVEADTALVQPVPVALVTNRERTKVLVARKTKKSLGAKSAEKDRDLFYFGGHVRPEDASGQSDLLSTLSVCLARELKEELDLDYDPQMQDAICIWDRGHSKSQHHIAVATVCEVNFETADFSADGKEFSEKSLEVITIEEFQARHNLKFEKWSTVMLQKLAGWTLV